jgi:aspartyl-tRNA synthetase
MSYLPHPAQSKGAGAAAAMGFDGLSEQELIAVLQLAGLPAVGTKAELAAQLKDAAKSAPDPATALGMLRNRVRQMEERVATLESGASVAPAPAATPAPNGGDAQAKADAQGLAVRQLKANKAPKPEIDAAVNLLKQLKAAAAASAPPAAEKTKAPAPAPDKAKASGIKEADLADYLACQPPKIKGKPTPEQKAEMTALAAKKKDFVKKLSERLGGSNTVKAVTKELDKMVKQGLSASKRPVEEVKIAEKVPLSAVSVKADGSAPEPRFGEFKLIQSDCMTGRKWTNVSDITADMDGNLVWIRARKYVGRATSKKLCFVTLRQQFSTIQCVVGAGDAIPVDMSALANATPTESIVDVLAEVKRAAQPVSSCSQSDVELFAQAFFVVSKSESKLPLQVIDAARSQAEIEEAKAKTPDAKMVEVKLDTRLNNRMLDLRTPANQAIMKINAAVGQYFRQFLVSEDFTEIHSPKIIAGASEGGAAVFKMQYMDLGTACLAQSPQLYKQMGVNCDLERVFEIGPVFRAEKSFTNRHLTEYTGLDFEMSFKDHYSESLEIMDRMFTYIFDNLAANMRPELEAIRKQYPFEDLRYSKPWKAITHREAVEMLNTWGKSKMPALRKATPGWMHDYLEHEVAKESVGTDEDEPPEPDLPPLSDDKRAQMRPFKNEWVTTMQCANMGYMDDFSTPEEKQLGRIMHDEHNTDFYIVDKFPLAVRPFYTMPDPVNPEYSNSYDIFLRGEEIMSGAQRIHDPEVHPKRV